VATAPAQSLIVANDSTDEEPAGMDFFALKAWVKASLEKHSGWYKEARASYDFAAGHQWDEDDRSKLQASGVPPIVFNLMEPTISAVSGMEVNNRQEVKFLPRTEGDAEVDERLTDLAEWVRDGCQAEDEETDAFRDDLICGRAVTDTRLDFEDEPTGKVVVDRLDPLECFVDPAARKSNFADARYMGNFRDLDTAEAEAMFPGVVWSALDANWASTVDVADGGEGYKRDYPEETRAALRGDTKKKSVRVVCIQWWENEQAYLIDDGQGGVAQIDDAKWQQLEEMHAEAGVPAPQAQPVMVRVYRRAFLGRNSILPNPDGEEIETTKMFSLTWMTGKWDRKEKYHYGLARPLMDPQRIVNKMLIQMHQILNTNAKGGLMIEKGAFANAREAELDWSNPSKTIVLQDGAISGKKIQERTSPPIPQAITQLLEFSMSAIRNVTGINLEILGAADREQAASLEYQRRQAATTILAPWFDALRRYRKTQGPVLIDCLRRLPPGVLVRVVKDDPEGQGEQQNAFVKFDPAMFGLTDEQARFDIIVDEAPSSPNQKQETWSLIQPFLAGFANNPKVMEVALKYSPLPLAAAKEFADAIGGGGLPPEVQQAMQQGQQQIAQLTQENQSLKADKSIEAAKVQQQGQKDAASAQTAQFQAETDRVHKVGQLGGDGQGDSELEILKLHMQQQFEAMEAARQRDHEALMQHLKNAGQIAASRVRAEATADQGIETSSEVGV